MSAAIRQSVNINLGASGLFNVTGGSASIICDNISIGDGVSTLNFDGSGQLTVPIDGDDTGVLVNNNNSLYCDSSALKLDIDNKFTGIQQPNPTAPLHVAAILGETILAPSSISSNAVLEDDVDAPGTANATQFVLQNPSQPVINLLYTYGIDINVTANVIPVPGTGFVSNGQLISYLIYMCRFRNGVYYTTDSTFAYGEYFDFIGDGSTFDLDISWTVTSTNFDCFVIYRFDDFDEAKFPIMTVVPAYYDAKTVSGIIPTTHILNFANSLSWNAATANYKTINGTKYRSNYITATPVVDDGSGHEIVLEITGYNLGSTYEGFVARDHAGSTYDDIGNVTAYYDASSFLESDLATFSSIAFPYFNTSLSGATSPTITINYGSGSLVANGSSYYVEVWEYRTHSSGARYFVSSPATSSTVVDNNSSNPLSLSGNFTIGNGSGRVVLLYRNSVLVGGLNVGATNTYSGLDSADPAPAVTPSISSYAGISRTFNTYGRVTVPAVRYSPAASFYLFTDTNPTSGYIIQHNYGSFGNATELKTLQTGYQSGSLLGLSATTSAFYQLNNGVGDLVVTPTTSSFLGNGDTYKYDIFPFTSVPTPLIYAATPASTSITLPNTGLNYYINITFSTVAAATGYKFRRQINSGAFVYNTSYTTSPAVDYAVTSWAANSTITPTFSNTTAAIFEKALDGTSDEPGIIISRNTTDDYLYNMNELKYKNSGLYETAGKFGIAETGNFSVSSVNGGLEIGELNSSPNTVITTNTIFNNDQNSSYTAKFRGSSTANSLLNIDATVDTIFIGQATSVFDPSSALVIQPNYATDSAMVISPKIGNVSTDSLVLIGSSSRFDNAGNLSLNSASTPLAARLRIGNSTTTITQLQLENSTSLPVPPIAGSFERRDSDGPLYWTDSTNTRKRIILQLANSTADRVWRSDASGMPITDTSLVISSSSVFVAKNLVISPVSAAVLSLSNLVQISGTINYSIFSISGSTTLDTVYPFYVATETVTYTLPTAVGIRGRTYEIKNAGVGTVTLNTAPGQTIDTFASGTIVLAAKYYIRVTSDGTNWMITGFYKPSMGPP